MDARRQEHVRIGTGRDVERAARGLIPRARPVQRIELDHRDRTVVRRHPRRIGELARVRLFVLQEIVIEFQEREILGVTLERAFRREVDQRAQVVINAGAHHVQDQRLVPVAGRHGEVWPQHAAHHLLIQPG